MPTAELCRTHGIASQTLYRWKGKYGGIEASEAKRLREQIHPGQFDSILLPLIASFPPANIPRRRAPINRTGIASVAM